MFWITFLIDVLYEAYFKRLQLARKVALPKKKNSIAAFLKRGYSSEKGSF